MRPLPPLWPAVPRPRLSGGRGGPRGRRAWCRPGGARRRAGGGGEGIPQCGPGLEAGARAERLYAEGRGGPRPAAPDALTGRRAAAAAATEPAGQLTNRGPHPPAAGNLGAGERGPEVGPLVQPHGLPMPLSVLLVVTDPIPSTCLSVDIDRFIAPGRA